MKTITDRPYCFQFWSVARVAAEQAEEAALDDVALLARVDARHPDAQRVAERDQDGCVDEDLGGALSHQRLLPANQRVDEVDEHGERDRETEGVTRGHQIRSRVQRSTKTTAKQPAVINNA